MGLMKMHMQQSSKARGRAHQVGPRSQKGECLCVPNMVPATLRENPCLGKQFHVYHPGKACCWVTMTRPLLEGRVSFLDCCLLRQRQAFFSTQPKPLFLSQGGTQVCWTQCLSVASQRVAQYIPHSNPWCLDMNNHEGSVSCSVCGEPPIK